MERLFFDLKEVLNLHRFHAASPNAAAMRAAQAWATLAGIELGYRLACLENLGRRLRPPDLRSQTELTTTLKQIRVVQRKGPRRKRRCCAGRRRWKSFAHVPAGRKLIN